LQRLVEGLVAEGSPSEESSVCDGYLQLGQVLGNVLSKKTLRQGVAALVCAKAKVGFPHRAPSASTSDFHPPPHGAVNRRSLKVASRDVRTPLGPHLRRLVRWRLECDPQSVAERVASMRRVNPAFIPRNRRVEAVLNADSQGSDFEPFYQLLGILQRP
jgi:hypothetical protein